MKVLVLNGSPKGEYSITLQTSLYLEKKFPEHKFQFLRVGQNIRSFEKDFSTAAEAITGADLIIFSYPVYTFIAPSQLHRFIELLKASGISVSGKFATQITTSKHFYDVTAHKYIQENCQDLGMKYVRGLSADMDDLLTEDGRKTAKEFFEYVCWSMKHDVYETIPKGTMAPTHLPISPVTSSQDKKSGDVVIITDCAKDDKQLSDMIDRFRAVLKYKSRIVNISQYPFHGGCLGCFNCAATGKCIYKDGFDDFLRNNIQTADAIVYAFSIKDHSMGSIFKMYDDRQFCNGHRTVTMGMPMGYLISGNYSSEANLQMIVEGRSEVGGNFLAGVACDEANPDAEIDRLAARLDYAIANKYIQPRNFYGVGGMKIFRDLIWIMRGLMKADHRFYKKHGIYDFPQKQKVTALKMYLVGALISSPKMKSKMGNKMNEGMLAPYKKVLDES
ncbi:NAD(P)H-dependent oxidoreductase [Acetivibrio mesophilus]|uniref:Iron-sulfur protein n=1 Tax=Acetivibrio mesophilus TaxID=2487273 RepID=A0A4Q0I0Z3_9FIRM|nr:NAD(P)H-dependent oxidoreductase [Acetivibrio mesophilus]ODM27921.1 iron-sulfur protein [Clostridium sp. Bc-iso-3]RXE57848.1 iron-sulfur protein [Acetivibrio mesophilus]HHV28219.1 iron-sulfur protein [Clostridium sp.]